MCRPTTCSVCQKTTWAGCGNHVDQVKASVPAGQWCNGEHAAAEKQAANAGGAGLFARLFGR